MEIIGWSAVFVAGLFTLVWAANRFIQAAEAIGLGLGLSPFIIGVTVVAFGTSFPELVSGVAGVLAGASEIAVGTAVGSNITNILLILGIAAALGGGLHVDYEVVRVDLPFLFGSALLVWFFAYDGSIWAGEGVIGLAALAVYVAYAASTPDSPGTTVAATASEMKVASVVGGRAGTRVWVWLLVSALITQGSAYVTVQSILELSEALSLGSEIIATSALALGTSLPELVVSAQSARAGKPEIAVGNVIGSNIFNVLGVVGIASLFGTLAVPATLSGFALPAMVGATVLGFFVLQEREVTRWDAWLLLILYLGFLLQMVALS